MTHEVKIRLEEEELDLLNELVENMRETTKVSISRTAVAHACFRHGWLVMKESYGPLPTNRQQIV